MPPLLLRLALLLAFVVPASWAPAVRLEFGQARVWETQEITFQAARDYANAYREVDLWIELEGPGFQRRIYGFWDGDRTFKVRFVATAPGEWRWRSGSNQPEDAGLNNGSGRFTAFGWPEEDLAANANRRGFVRATSNGRALVYADGTPFFLVGDTWLAASTWRLPWKGAAAAPDYQPGPGISFEEAVAYRKRQGYNSVSLIAAFPNWAADHHGATYADAQGVFLRNAWEKFGHWAPNATVSTADGATTTAKNMEDEHGNRSFALHPRGDGLADFDRINPAYFRSLDRKMKHLADEGFVPFFETVRRDHGPSWKAYFDFNASYARFVQYLVARYGAYNLVFSGIHLDWIPEKFSLPARDWNAALSHWLNEYGPLPYGQPFTTLIDSSTYRAFGHGEQAPWLTMHTAGNNPRNHAIYGSIEEMFRLQPAYPVANLEPYYAGWFHMINRPGGEMPAADSERDSYFARAMMYGSVLSGALAGHVYGTGAYDLTSTGEPAGWRPHIWTALRYTSGAQMQHLQAFVLSEGERYQDLLLASDDLSPRSIPDALADGLDGWSFMMRTADRTLALLYFEVKALRPYVRGLQPHATYQWTWYNPRTGEWGSRVSLVADARGQVHAPPFPDSPEQTASDVAARLVRVP